MKKLLKNTIKALKKIVRSIAVIDYSESDLIKMSSPCWAKTVLVLPTESKKNVF